MSVVSTDPPKWWEVYENDDECKLFKALSREEWDWRTTQALAKATGLSIKRVQEIISRYLPTNIVRAHSEEPDKWQYWERAKSKSKKGSIAEENQNKRIKDAKAATP